MKWGMTSKLVVHMLNHRCDSSLKITINLDYIRFLFFLGLQRNPLLGTDVLEVLRTRH